MYKIFMTNYSKTLKDMLENSKNFYANKARGRKTLKEEQDVPEERVLRGRRPNHFLYKPDIDETAYQRHLRIFKAELERESQIFLNKDQIEAEVRKRVEEEEKAKEEEERQKSIERRKRIVIIREDL